MITNGMLRIRFWNLLSLFFCSMCEIEAQPDQKHKKTKTNGKQNWNQLICFSLSSELKSFKHSRIIFFSINSVIFSYVLFQFVYMCDWVFIKISFFFCNFSLNFVFVFRWFFAHNKNLLTVHWHSRVKNNNDKYVDDDYARYIYIYMKEEIICIYIFKVECYDENEKYIVENTNKSVESTCAVDTTHNRIIRRSKPN